MITMMYPVNVEAIGQAHRAELHDQAQRAALARIAYRATRHQRRQRAPGLLATLTGLARRPRPVPENS